MKNKVFITCYFLIIFTLVAKVNQSKDLEIYKKLSYAKILALTETNKNNNQRLGQKLAKMLNLFYSNFTQEKKIQQDQKIGQLLDERNRGQLKLNKNQRRLLLRKLSRKVAQSHLILEAPNLFLAHFQVGRAYLRMAKDSQPMLAKASYHLYNALRYRTLKLSKKVYFDHNRLILLEQPKKQKKILAHERLQDIIKQQVLKLKNEKIKLSVMLDNARSSKRIKQRANIYQDIKIEKKLIIRLKKSIKKNQQVILNFEKTYNAAQLLYNRYSANFLIELAGLLFELEKKLKDRQKILNRSTFIKSSFNSINDLDYSENRNFEAYANLLEQASRLDKHNPEVAWLLANEYRKSQKKSMAIEFYKKTIQIQNSTSKTFALPDEKITQSYRYLAGLYNQNRRYVDATANYEKAYLREKNKRKKNILLYELGKLHAQKTGNFARAKALISKYLRENPLEKNIELPKLLKSVKSHIKLNSLLALSNKKLREYTLMQKNYEVSLSIFHFFEEVMAKQKIKIKQSFDKLQSSKRPLLKDTSVDELAEYYKAKSTYGLSKDELLNMQAVKNSLAMENIFFNLASYFEERKNYTRALELYQEAEKKGIRADLARRHQMRLNQR